MFLFIIFIFLSGDNFMISFLEHQYWNFVARPYFSFLILINSISYYIFYQIESRVKIEFFNILFNSINDDCIIIIAGDYIQLPSIGVGTVFKDLIDCEKIPCVELKDILR